MLCERNGIPCGVAKAYEESRKQDGRQKLRSRPDFVELQHDHQRRGPINQSHAWLGKYLRR